MTTVSFQCPHCKNFLNVGEHLVFSAKTKKNKRGIIILSPKIGDYSVTTNPNFQYTNGELIDFYCPLCHANLHAFGLNENLAKINMLDENGQEFELYFSEIAGEKCTYTIKDKKIEAYGENAHKYMAYFNLASMK